MDATDLSGVVRVIRDGDNLNDVAVAFIVFRAMTGAKDVKMFDFKTVNEWCASHESQCKPTPPPAQAPATPK